MEYKYAIAAAIIISVVGIFGTVNAQSDALSIANLAIYPQPVTAGSNITIGFNLYNSYQGELQNVNLELVGTYPLLNYSPAGTDLITQIPNGLYEGTSLISYKIHVPKNVKSGTYSLQVLATYETTTAGSSTTQASYSSTMPISFYVQGTPDLKLTANPTSAISPGAQSTVNIAVLNVGTDNATNTTVSVLNSANFSVVGGSTFNLGTIAPQQTSTATALILTNSTLRAGTAQLPIIIRYNTEYGASSSYEEMVPVSVSLGNPNVVVGIVSAQPASLYPGTNQTLTLSLQNTGSGTAKNVTLSVLNNRNLTAGNSASRIFIGTIAAGATATASVFITANKNDNMSKYGLPIYISYQNANYNLTTNRTTLIPITLQSIARFNITSSSSSLVEGGTYLPITLTVKNTGNEPAQSVTFTLQTIYPLSQVTPNAYVGALEPGQSTNVTFYLNVDSQASVGQYPLTLYEQWSQPTGTSSQQYSSSQDYYASVVSSGGGSYTTIIIIALIVVIAGVVIMRRRKQSTAKKEKK